MKKTLVNISLEDGEIATLDALAGRALNRQAVARMLLTAAIEAVQNNQGRLHFPPHFEVSEAAPNRMNEPQPKRK